MLMIHQSGWSVGFGVLLNRLEYRDMLMATVMFPVKSMQVILKQTSYTSHIEAGSFKPRT